MNNFIIYPRIGILHMFSLREKYSNTEFLLVRIFLYLVRIQGNTNQKKLRIWTLFTHMFQLKVTQMDMKIIFLMLIFNENQHLKFQQNKYRSKRLQVFYKIIIVKYIGVLWKPANLLKIDSVQCFPLIFSRTPPGDCF